MLAASVTSYVLKPSKITDSRFQRKRIATGAKVAQMNTRSIINASVLAAMFLMARLHQAAAFEPGASFATFPGILMGEPVGALPAATGLYFEDLIHYGEANLPTIMSQTPYGPGSIKSDSAAMTPTLLWSSPFKTFGASYGAALVQPMTSIHNHGYVNGPEGLQNVTSHEGVIHDTEFIPAILSWNLTGGFFTSAAIGVYVPDGRISGINGLSSLIGSPFYTIEPAWAISYLADGWNLTASFLYDFNMENPYSKVVNGQSMNIDLTATKTFGKFEFGPVAYFAFQTTSDSGGNLKSYLATIGSATPANYCGQLPAGLSSPCSRASVGGLGGRLGYDFGPARLSLEVTDSLFDHGQGGLNGWRIWTRLAFPLYSDDPKRQAEPGGLIARGSSISRP